MNGQEKYTFLIDEETQSTRIDSVLSLLLPETSRSFIVKLIEGGGLAVNGKECTWKYDDQNSNDKNLIIKIFDGAEHICGGQVSTSLDGSIFYFRAMEAPFVFCPGVWEKSE